MEQAQQPPTEQLSRPRFCGVCGAALQSDGAPCDTCSRRAPAPAVQGQASISLRYALGLYFSLLLVILAGSIAANMTDADTSPDISTTIDIWTSVLFSCIIAIAAIPVRRALTSPLSRPGPAHWYLIAPVTGLLTATLASLFMNGLSKLIGLPDHSYSKDFIDAGYSWLVPIALVAVQPAVFEELAFRGVIGSTMQRVLGQRDAILVTALLFAALHLSPMAFPHLFIIGLALGIVRRKSGSLYPCMLLHFTHNSLILVAEYTGL